MKIQMKKKQSVFASIRAFLIRNKWKKGRFFIRLS